MNTLWSNHTTEHYSVTKRNKPQMHATTWVSLKNIMLIKIDTVKFHLYEFLQ